MRGRPSVNCASCNVLLGETLTIVPEDDIQNNVLGFFFFIFIFFTLLCEFPSN